MTFFYSKRIEKTYIAHTSWKILKRKENICDERKENPITNRKRKKIV